MFYHISKKDLGQTVKLKPRVPSSSLVSREGNIPRICVTPSLYLCALSIVSFKPVGVRDLLIEYREEETDNIISPVVYYTDETPYLPPRVSDFRLTKEHWFLKPTLFNRLGYICLKSLVEYNVLRCVEEKNILDINTVNSDLIIKNRK